MGYLTGDVTYWCSGKTGEKMGYREYGRTHTKSMEAKVTEKVGEEL